jgi:hypothetical protein
VNETAVSPRDIQIGQVMIGAATAVFIGLRFVPPPYRRRVGVSLIVCYLAGVALFMLYLLTR